MAVDRRDRGVPLQAWARAGSDQKALYLHLTRWGRWGSFPRKLDTSGVHMVEGAFLWFTEDQTWRWGGGSWDKRLFKVQANSGSFVCDSGPRCVIVMTTVGSVAGIALGADPDLFSKENSGPVSRSSCRRRLSVRGSGLGAGRKERDLGGGPQTCELHVGAADGVMRPCEPGSESRQQRKPVQPSRGLQNRRQTPAPGAPFSRP